MGVAACRLVMVETVDDEGKPLSTPPAPAGSALMPALALLGITAARAAGWLTLNDPLTRALLFVPLFTLLVVRIHRNTLQGAKGFTAMLGHPLLTYLVSTASRPLHGLFVIARALVVALLMISGPPAGYYVCARYVRYCAFCNQRWMIISTTKSTIPLVLRPALVLCPAGHHLLPHLCAARRAGPALLQEDHCDQGLGRRHATVLLPRLLRHRAAVSGSGAEVFPGERMVKVLAVACGSAITD